MPQAEPGQVEQAGDAEQSSGQKEGMQVLHPWDQGRAEAEEQEN